MRLLTISNGHGEDVIAAKILQALQRLAPAAHLAGLPLVGEGGRYARLGIDIVGPTQAMPSGGFIYMDGRELWRDVRGGLLGLTGRQLQAVRQWGQGGGAVLAVGDIVPLIFGWLSGCPYSFVGTAKSDYYVRDEVGPYRGRRQASAPHPPTFYDPWDHWLMHRPACQGVFPRDRLTALALQRRQIRAIDAGNPMMDGFEIPTEREVVAAVEGDLSVLLLPGSRVPEAYANWGRILTAVPSLIEAYPSAQLLVAAAPALDATVMGRPLSEQGWQPVGPGCFQLNRATLTISASQFVAFAQQATVAIAMAGTATEQFVGLGKPAITLPGSGPQFTPAFARAQTRLLGSSVTLIDRPETAGQILTAILSDPERRTQIYRNGRRRMGDPGAAERIAIQLLKWFGEDQRLD
ncbi:MAG: lipid-A-disaccharide synthase-related protein [Cyanobacteria bacterium J06648_16]